MNIDRHSPAYPMLGEVGGISYREWGIPTRMLIATEMCKTLLGHKPYQVLAREETVAEAYAWADAIMAGNVC